MATYNRTVSQSTAPHSAASRDYGQAEVLVEQILDFSATGNTNASADIFEAILIPAGYTLGITGMEVLKVDSAGNSGTIILKNDSTSRGTAQAPTSTGFNANYFSSTVVAPSSSNGYVNVVIGTGAINAVVRVYAVLRNIRAKTGTPVVTGTTTNPAGQTTVVGADPAGYTLTYIT